LGKSFAVVAGEFQTWNPPLYRSPSKTSRVRPASQRCVSPFSWSFICLPSVSLECMHPVSTIRLFTLTPLHSTPPLHRLLSTSRLFHCLTIQSRFFRCALPPFLQSSYCWSPHRRQQSKHYHAQLLGYFVIFYIILFDLHCIIREGIRFHPVTSPFAAHPNSKKPPTAC